MVITKNNEYISPSAVHKAADFSVRLLQHTYEPVGNTLISPTTLLSALTMAPHGARGLTEKEMEVAICRDADSLSHLLSRMFSSKLDLEEKMWKYLLIHQKNFINNLRGK